MEISISLYQDLRTIVEQALYLHPDQTPPSIDPEQLETVASYAIDRHRVGAFIYGWMRRYDDPTPHIPEAYAEAYQRNGLQQLAQQAAHRKIENILTKEDIRLVPIKGLSLANELYAHPGWRQARDIDLLVAPQHFRAAIQCLIDHKFILKTPEHWDKQGRHQNDALKQKDISFLDPGSNIIIELHQRLFDYEPAGFSNAFYNQISGTSVADQPLYCLYIIMHAANSFWSRLKWVVDAILLLQNMTPDTRNDMILLAKAYGCEQAVWGSLSFITANFPRALDEDWQNRLSNKTLDKKSRILPALFQARLESMSRTTHDGLGKKPKLFIPRQLIMKTEVGWPEYLWRRSTGVIKRHLIQPLSDHL